MKKLFNKGVYISTLKQLIYLSLLMLFIGAILVFANQRVVLGDWWNMADKSFSYNIANPPFAVLTFIGSITFSLYAISFAWNRKKADFEYSTPVTKGSLYVSKVLAVLSIQTLVLVITFLMCIFATFDCIGLTVFVDDMLFSLLNAVIGSMIIVGAVFLSASVTGKPLSTILLSLGIITLPTFIIQMDLFYLIERTYRTDYHMVFKSSLYVLNNLLLSTARISLHVRYLPGILSSLALAVFYFTVGYFLFRKRSGELTGNHTKNKLVHYIVMAVVPSYIILFACRLFFTYELFISEVQATLIIMLSAALILTFAYDIWVRKNWKYSYRCIFVFLGLIILIQGKLQLGRMNWEKHYMEEIDGNAIESICIDTTSTQEDLTGVDLEVSYGEYIASDYVIEDREIINKIMEYYNRNYVPHTETSKVSTYYYLMIKLNYNSLKSKYEHIPIYVEYNDETGEVYDNVHTQVKSLTGYSEKYYACVPLQYVVNVSYYGEFLTPSSAEKMKEVYEIFIEEYNQLTVEEKKELAHSNIFSAHPSKQGLTGEYMQSAVIYVKGRVNGFNTLDIFHLTELTPNALELYRETIDEIAPYEFEQRDK